MSKRFTFFVIPICLSILFLSGLLGKISGYVPSPLQIDALPEMYAATDVQSTISEPTPLYLTATLLLEELGNGDLIELVPVQHDWLFDNFFILQEEITHTLWLNNRYQPGGSRVSVEQHLQSVDGLIWKNRVDTNLVDNTPDYRYLRGIRQVVKNGDMYEGWESYYYNTVSGMWVPGIRYINSSDGITWSIANNTALISGRVQTIIKEGDVYHMWARPAGDTGYTGPRMLRYRTSSEPGDGWGHWQTGGTAVNVDGEEVWLQNRVRKLNDDTYQLFYRPYEAENPHVINLATSTNGITFTLAISQLVDYPSILPDFNALHDFQVVNVNGDDWFYFTYRNTADQGRVAVVRSEEEIVAGLTAVNDSPTVIGNSTTLSATITGGTNVMYSWNFGDGVVDSGAYVSHIYPATGQYTAVVTASNAANVLTTTTVITIHPDVHLAYLPIVSYSSCSEISLPVDVILSLDTSGSMAWLSGNGVQTKLDVSKEAASVFIDLLNFTSDQAGIISFDDEATIDHHLSDNASSLQSALQALVAGGTTRIDLALAASRYELTSPYHNPNSATVLILLTDGQPSTPEDEVLAEADAAKGVGITIFTIGLGEDVNTNLMQDMASSPTYYYYAPSTAELTAIYEQIANIVHCP